MLSATLANEQNQAQTQFAAATAMAKGTEQLLKVMETLEQIFLVKQQESEALSLVRAKGRKELESEIIDTERQIQSVKNRLDEIFGG